MIKANELRIGNYVTGFDKHNSNGKILSIWRNQTLTDIQYNRKDIHLTDAFCGPCLIESLLPIPITPEILEKAGFKHRSINGNLYDMGYVLISMADGKPIEKSFTVAAFDTFCVVLQCNHHHIKYFHQLQNLYFALTSTELEINL